MVTGEVVGITVDYFLAADELYIIHLAYYIEYSTIVSNVPFPISICTVEGLLYKCIRDP